MNAIAYAIDRSWTLGCLMSAPSYKTEAEAPTGADVLMELLNQPQEEPETDRERSQQWMGQYGMYKKLLADAELRNATPELSDFFQTKENSNIGRLHHAMADFNRLRNAQAGGVYTALFQEHQEAVQSITLENRAEQTLSEVMRILYANMESIENMNATEEAQMRTIAQRYPLDDGFGVYMARAALLKIDALPRNYISECERAPAPREEDARWKDEGIQNNEANGFSVYPNPNNGYMVVNYLLEEGEHGGITIYNAIGALVFQETLNSGINRTELQLKAESGIYLINIVVNNDIKLTQRLSIIKE